MTSARRTAESRPSICVLRLSSIGDVVQAIPAVNALRDAFPESHITWVVGAREATIVRQLPGVEIVPLSKGAMAGASLLKERLRHRSFGVLLHMQTSLRANLTSLAVPARRRIGFDRARSRELHGAVVTERIPATPNEHVLDGFLSFARTLGATPRLLRRAPPLTEAARAFARPHLPEGERYLVINPCASDARRDWTVEGYADVAAAAVETHGLRVVLTGAPTPRERAVTAALRERVPGGALNLVGKDDLTTLPAILERAEAVVSPDTGPAHLAAAVGTPVIGLYAVTNPRRSGPYGSLQWCVDRFPEAARRYRGVEPRHLPWRTRINAPGVMDLIRPEDVRERLSAVLASRPHGPMSPLPGGGAPPATLPSSLG